MADYLIFDSESEADDAQSAIWQFGVGLAQAAGYTASVSGIVGRKNGIDDPENRMTLKWDSPKQINDGRWIITHPSKHAAAQDPAKLAAIMVALGEVVEGDNDGSWFTE